MKMDVMVAKALNTPVNTSSAKYHGGVLGAIAKRYGGFKLGKGLPRELIKIYRSKTTNAVL